MCTGWLGCALCLTWLTWLRQHVHADVSRGSSGQLAPVLATFFSCYRFFHYSFLKVKFTYLFLCELTVSFPGWAPFSILYLEKNIKKNVYIYLSIYIYI